MSILFYVISGLLFVLVFSAPRGNCPTDFKWVSMIAVRIQRALLLIASGIFAIAGILS